MIGQECPLSTIELEQVGYKETKTPNNNNKNYIDSKNFQQKIEFFNTVKKVFNNLTIFSLNGSESHRF